MSDDKQDQENERAVELTPDELMQKLEEAEQKANQHWERVLRMQAENDNALRRADDPLGVYPLKGERKQEFGTV